jgi:O-antigen/teichoic acid export membrane protein
MTSLKKKSIKGFIWDFTGKLGLQGVGFFVSIILARILLPEDFGLLAIITVFINLASVFLDFGFSTALVQRSEVTEEHYSSVFFMNVMMGIFLGILVFLSAPFIAKFYENEVLVNLIRVMSFSFVINAFGNVTRAHLRRAMDFKLMSIANIASAFISGFIAVFLAYKGFGIWSLVIQILISQILSNSLLYVISKFRFKLTFSIIAAKELWGFSSKIFFTGVLDTVFMNLDSLLIGKLLNPATLGYYYRSKSLQSFTTRYTSSTISNVLLPSLSTMQNEPIRLKNAVIKSLHLLSFISFLSCGLLFVCSEEIIILLFSDKWAPSIKIFQIIILGSFSTQIFSIFFNTLLSTGNSTLYLKLNLINKTLLFLNFGVLFIWGLDEYLIGYIINMFGIYCLAMFQVSKILCFKRILYFISFRYLLVYAITITCCLLISSVFHFDSLLLNLFFKLFLFLFLFLFLLYVVNNKGFSLCLDEFKGIFKLIGKEK